MEGFQRNMRNLLNLDRFGFVVTKSSQFQLFEVARRHASVSVYCFCNKLYKCKKVTYYYLNTNCEGAKGKPAYKEWASSVK